MSDYHSHGPDTPPRFEDVRDPDEDEDDSDIDFDPDRTPLMPDPTPTQIIRGSEITAALEAAERDCFADGLNE